MCEKEMALVCNSFIFTGIKPAEILASAITKTFPLPLPIGSVIIY